jgi:hypothetical protein
VVKRSRPNGGVQPPRARWNSLQNANDLAREAVGWNDVFGAPAKDVPLADRFAPTTPAQDHICTTGFYLNHAHLGSHPAQRALI